MLGMTDILSRKSVTMTTEEISVHTFDGVPQREGTPPQEGRLSTNRTTGTGFFVRDMSALV
mgnify:CR=1 FL=1